MKKIFIILIISFSSVNNMFSHDNGSCLNYDLELFCGEPVHQRIVLEAYELLKLQLSREENGFADMDQYIGTAKRYDHEYEWNKISTIACGAEHEDSILLPGEEYLIENEEYPESEKKSYGLGLIAIGGLGMTANSVWGFWINDFHNGPAAGIGLEVPFTESHIFSLELYYHHWIAKSREPDDNYGSTYNHISSDTYSQGGASFVLKFYPWSNKNKFRVSAHIGTIILAPNSDYYAADIGLGMYYSISEKIYLSIIGRAYPVFPDPGGGTDEYVPNNVMLNFNYKFNLGG